MKPLYLQEKRGFQKKVLSVKEKYLTTRDLFSRIVKVIVK